MGRGKGEGEEEFINDHFYDASEMWECGRGEKEGSKVAHCGGTVSGMRRKITFGNSSFFGVRRRSIFAGNVTVPELPCCARRRRATYLVSYTKYHSNWL